jgi:FkbM family methyltransferase
MTGLHGQKIWKLLKLISVRTFRDALGKGVAAGTEHTRHLSTLKFETIVDVGANKGQFALAARWCFPQAMIHSFEPLARPAMKFRRVLAGDDKVKLHEVAVGPFSGSGAMHVSRHDDSSSLLSITPLQEELFPGTGEFAQETVSVGPLDAFVSDSDFRPPALLKIDVQGYELEALKGCERMLDRFSHVYVECSFVELYSGQASASEVADYLHRHGFVLNGVYNLTYDRAGLAIQGDFLFSRANAAQV